MDEAKELLRLAKESKTIDKLKSLSEAIDFLRKFRGQYKYGRRDSKTGESTLN